MNACPLCGCDLEEMLNGPDGTGFYYCVNEACTYQFDAWEESEDVRDT